MTIGTTEAASLLGICPQRVRQLLKNGRIEGAKKNGGVWQIPLYDGKPRVLDGSRGPKSKFKTTSSS